MTVATTLPMTVQCTNLSMAYGRREVLADLTFAVPQGGVYALLGRNGAGKSTLVRTLLGFEAARRGQVQLFGLDAWRERTRTMARVGVVPETPEVPPRMTSAQAAAFCGSLCPTWDHQAVAQRLARFNLDVHLPFSRLSRGQQTQVALCLALGGRPELLILDDPTLGLDPVARRDLYRELLEDLGERGTTLFITTHDLAGIEGLADRVGILSAGVLDEPMETLKARFRRIHAGPAASEASLKPLGPVAMTGNAFGLEATVANFSPEALALAGLEPAAATGASLEDIFLALAADEVHA